MVPSRFPPELRKILCRFPPGTLRLEVGIQTLNLQTAALIGRYGNPQKALEALEFLAEETNAIIHADLIAGLPGEDMKSFGRGFDLLWAALSPRGGETAPAEIQCGILKLLPGAAIARHTAAYQMRYSPEPPYEVMETGVMPAAELARIKNFARFWEIIVNRNPFPSLRPRLLPPGEAVFDRFMVLSDRLFGHFGRNWGIDRKELERELEA
jgi:hypothetical protein